MFNTEFGTKEVVDVLSEKAEERGSTVEINGDTVTCYDGGGEPEARVEVYDGNAGGSIASVGYDEEGVYSEALDAAAEDVDGVGFSRGQVMEFDPLLQ